MSISKLDHIQEGLALLISQYKDKPRIEAVLTSFLQSIQQLEDGIIDTAEGILNIKTSIGAQLDICGAILNEKRNGNPDFIYRRTLLAKTNVIKSQGRIKDLIEVIVAYQDLINAPSSEILFASSDSVSPEGRSVEITLFPNKENLLSDPAPFNPKGQHDLLLSAKGAGEQLQSIYPIVNVGQNPKFDALRFSHNPTGNVPPMSNSGLGSIALSLVKGPLSHRREELSRTTEIGEHYNQTPPLVTWSIMQIGEPLTITPGEWGNFPELFSYTLYRSSSLGLIPDPVLTDVSLDMIQGYQISYEDVGFNLYVGENATRLGVVKTALSNIVWADIHEFDFNIQYHWRFSDATISAGYITEVPNLIQSGLYNLVQSSSFFQPRALSDMGISLLGYDAGAFNPFLFTHMELTNTSSAQTIERPYSILAVAMPTGSLANPMAIMHGRHANPAIQSIAPVFSGSYATILRDGAGPTYIANSGSSISQNNAYAVAAEHTSYVNSDGVKLWVNDYRDSAAITGEHDRSWGFITRVGNIEPHGFAFDGYIWEVVVRTDELSSEARKIWAAYFHNRYGIETTGE